jgi:small subunit ribosomal protein S17
VKQGKVNKKTLVGVVMSDKMDKTVTIMIEGKKMHPIYKKSVKTRTKIKAHDGKNEASVGDLVRVIESRPLSKEKKWRLVKILEKAQRG